MNEQSAMPAKIVCLGAENYPGRDVGSAGPKSPTHFGALVYNLVYIFEPADVRRRHIVPGRRLASLKIRA